MSPPGSQVAMQKSIVAEQSVQDGVICFSEDSTRHCSLLDISCDLKCRYHVEKWIEIQRMRIQKDEPAVRLGRHITIEELQPPESIKSENA